MNTRPKPYAESCDQNRDPILNILQQSFRQCQHILEIGSGTGQHAVYFARHLPHLHWQTSEVAEHHAGIQAWLDDEGPDNVLPPVELDVRQPAHWPAQQFDGIFSANTVHIMGWPAVEQLFAMLGKVMLPGAVFCLYGPFNYNGKYTSDSNERFDAWLKSQAPERGIRDFEALNALAEQAGMTLLEDYPMPANNRILVWQQKRG